MLNLPMFWASLVKTYRIGDFQMDIGATEHHLTPKSRTLFPVAELGHALRKLHLRLLE